MAESVCTELARQRGVLSSLEISSAAAHTDAIGCPPHRGTVECLRAKGIPLIPHRARLMTARDGETYDLLIGMDRWNAEDMKRIAGKNASKVRDIEEGCNALLDFLTRQGIL